MYAEAGRGRDQWHTSSRHDNTDTDQQLYIGISLLYRDKQSALNLQFKLFCVICRWNTRRFYIRAVNNGGFGRRVPADAA